LTDLTYLEIGGLSHFAVPLIKVGQFALHAKALPGNP